MAGKIIFIPCFSILVSLLSLSEAGKCPTEGQVTSINLTTFSGEWYMVSGTSITGHAGKCLHFKVDHISENQFRMNFTTTSYRTNKRIWWRVEGNQFEKNLSATWQLNSSPRKLGPFEHRVISIDYSSYAAIIVCAADHQFIPKQYFAMIWSRQRTLAKNILVDLKDRIAEYISSEDIIDIDTTCIELDQ